MNDGELTVDYNAVLADLERRRDQILAAIVAVEGIIASVGASRPISQPSMNANAGVPPGAFFTMSIPEATKKYLNMVKRKQSTNKLREALAQGGLPQSKYSTIYAVLRRRESQVGDIINVDGEWALSEWNPNFTKKRNKAATAATAKQPDSPSESISNPVDLVDAQPAVKLTLGDGTERILRAAGKAVHVDIIVDRLARLGRKTNKRSLNSTLLQDTRKRFKLLGNNIFDLTEREPNN